MVRYFGCLWSWIYQVREGCSRCSQRVRSQVFGPLSAGTIWNVLNRRLGGAWRIREKFPPKQDPVLARNFVNKPVPQPVITGLPGNYLLASPHIFPPLSIAPVLSPESPSIAPSANFPFFLLGRKWGGTFCRHCLFAPSSTRQCGVSTCAVLSNIFHLGGSCRANPSRQFGVYATGIRCTVASGNPSPCSIFLRSGRGLGPYSTVSIILPYMYSKTVSPSRSPRHARYVSRPVIFSPGGKSARATDRSDLTEPDWALTGARPRP